jgi:DNA-binding PadR family transcriptional regulator
MNIRITVEIEKIAFRPVTSFEWAVLSLLERFSPTPPTIEEATDQLQLHEPRLLLDAIRHLTSEGAIVSRTDGAHIADLPNGRITEEGRAILREKGREWGSPVRENTELVVEWPGGKPLNTEVARHAKVSPAPKGVDQETIEQALDSMALEEWLNATSAQQWKLRRVYVLHA